MMTGKTISHYRILEKLGEGGMGVVYKAEDTKLKRTVALKFLPQHITAAEEERTRFLREAQAAAALNHPNICTIHAIEEGDNQQSIVMEHVEGRTLHEYIRQSPEVNLQSALDLAIHIGEALQEAHTKGIVHRDIKAQNIMVSSKNQIKVMDFGLAKLKGSLKLTRTSSTVGTLAYMAPEQIHGGDVDARSDIFSFGAVLFEMLTGRLPFRGEHEAALLYSIVNEAPESLSKLRDDVSPDLERIVNRALEKEPEDRYQHVDDMVNELRRLQKGSARVVRPDITRSSGTSQATSVSPTAPGKSRLRSLIAGAAVVIGAIAAWCLFFPKPSPIITSMAVLPFVNAGGDQSAEYLSDGFTESMINTVSLQGFCRAW